MADIFLWISSVFLRFIKGRRFNAILVYEDLFMKYHASFWILWLSIIVNDPELLSKVNLLFCIQFTITILLGNVLRYRSFLIIIAEYYWQRLLFQVNFTVTIFFQKRY